MNSIKEWTRLNYWYLDYKRWPAIKNCIQRSENLLLAVHRARQCRAHLYYGFDADLYDITIYRRIKTLDNLSGSSIQTILTFLWDYITNRLLNDTGTFIPSNVFMESTPPAACTWGINKFNLTFPTLFSSHQDPGPDSAPPSKSPDINLNLFQHFL